MKQLSSILTIRKDKLTLGNAYPLYFFIGKVKRAKTIRIATGYSVQKCDWDEKNKRVKSTAPFIEKKKFNGLSEKITEFDTYACDLQFRGINVNEEIVKSFFRTSLKQSDGSDFYSFFNDFIDQAKKIKNLSESTVKIYRSTYNVLKEFKKDLSFNDIDLDFVNKFDYYLKNERGNSKGGAFNRHKHLRTLIRLAIDKGFMFDTPYKRGSFKIQKPDNRRNAITFEELNKLNDLELPSLSLRRTRDMFIFSCFTGLRFSDVVALKRENLKIDGEQKSVIITQKKTKHLVEVPLIERASIIFEKYIFEEKNLFKVSNQKANKNLKEITKLMKNLRFELTFHISRHSCATILARLGATALQISGILGHAGLNEAMIYINLVQNDAKNTVELFNKKVV